MAKKSKLGKALKKSPSPVKKGSGSRARKKTQDNLDSKIKKAQAIEERHKEWDRQRDEEDVGLKDIALSAAGAIPYAGSLAGAGKLAKAVKGVAKGLGSKTSAGLQGAAGAVGQEVLDYAAQAGITPEQAQQVLAGGLEGGAIGAAKGFAKGKAKDLFKKGLKTAIKSGLGVAGDVAGATAKGIGIAGTAKAAYDTAQLANQMQRQNMTDEEYENFKRTGSTTGRRRAEKLTPEERAAKPSILERVSSWWNGEEASPTTKKVEVEVDVEYAHPLSHPWRGTDLLSEQVNKFGSAIPSPMISRSPLMNKDGEPELEEGESPEAYTERVYQWYLEKMREQNPDAFKNIERTQATKSIARASAEASSRKAFMGMEYDAAVNELRANEEGKYKDLEDQVNQAGERYESAKAELEAQGDFSGIEDEEERKEAEKAHKQALKDLKKSYDAEYKDLDNQIRKVDNNLRRAEKDAYNAYKSSFKDESKDLNAHIKAAKDNQKALTKEADAWRYDSEGMKRERDRQIAKQARKMEGTDSGSNQAAAAEARQNLSAQHQQMAQQAGDVNMEDAQEILRQRYAKRAAERKTQPKTQQESKKSGIPSYYRDSRGRAHRRPQGMSDAKWKFYMTQNK